MWTCECSIRGHHFGETIEERVTCKVAQLVGYCSQMLEGKMLAWPWCPKEAWQRMPVLRWTRR